MLVTSIEHELEALWRFALHLTDSRESAEKLVFRTCNRFYSLRQHSTSRCSLYRLQYRVWSDEIRTSPLRSVIHKRVSADTHGAQCFGNGLRETINQLPEAQRLVVFLICAEEFSYSEAADILSMSISTLMSRLVRARKAIGLQQRIPAVGVHSAIAGIS